MDTENICPECGSSHHQDFVRCPSCHAYIVEASPWNGDFNLLAIPISLLLWWGLDRLLLNRNMPTHDLVNDPISRAILGIAIYGLMVLVFKWRVISRQARAFANISRVCAQFPSTLDDDVLTAARDSIAESRLGAYNQFVAFHRLRWLVSAAKVDREDRAGLLEALRQHSESDWDSMESSFSFTQYLIWLLPSAGFLGTVWGMTQALKDFSKTVGSQSDLSFTAGLMDTAQGLGTAFHTTLVGLAAVIPLLAFATMLRRRSQNFLERTDKYFLRVAAQVLYHQQTLPEPAPLTLSELRRQSLENEPPVVGPEIIPEFPASSPDDSSEPEAIITDGTDSEPEAETEADTEAGLADKPANRDTTAQNLELWDKRDRDHLPSEGIY